MDRPDFGMAFVADLVDRCLSAREFTEQTGADGGPLLPLTHPEDPGKSAGWLRLWAGTGRVDRMIHVRLLGDPVDTQLFFVFARAETTVPHFHGQVVQFGPDACIYNADLLPRLDPVDHPGYYDAVFGPITKAYWQATQRAENACAAAPANPAIAAYLSPWSIGAARPATREELVRVGAQMQAYLAHWLTLADTLEYPGPAAAALRDRDHRHLACFFDERLDRRAWKGVYRLVGDAAGARLRAILMQNLY